MSSSCLWPARLDIKTSALNCIHGWRWSSGCFCLLFHLKTLYSRVACQPGKANNSLIQIQESLLVVKLHSLLQHITSRATTQQRAEVLFTPVCQTQSSVSPPSSAESPLLSLTLTLPRPDPPPCHCDPCQQSSNTFFSLLLCNNHTRTQPLTHMHCSLERFSAQYCLPRLSHSLPDSRLSTVSASTTVCLTPWKKKTTTHWQEEGEGESFMQVDLYK